MGEIKIPTDDELIRQIASGPEDTIVCGVSWEDEYKEYLESEREILVNLLLSGKPLSELDRTEIAHLLCPELYLPDNTNPPHRPKGTATTRHRNFKIALEYEELYQKGRSKQTIAALAEKFCISDESVRKALKDLNKFRVK